jgi:diguanylate cyclase (GGDEF)-like protein/PAS domain S-box-containing protein
MKQANTSRSIVKVVNLFSITTAVLVAIVLPVLFYFEDLLSEEKEVEAIVLLQTSAFNKVIDENPRAWPFERQRLEALAQNHVLEDDDPTNHIISDAYNTVLFSTYSDPLPWPVISDVGTLYANGEHIGFYTVERSLASLVSDTKIVALIALILAIIIGVPLRTIPLRALKRSFRDLEQEKEKALVTLQSIGDAVITTDAEMRVEYLNPIAEELTGWTTEEAKGLHMDTIFVITNEITGAPASNPISECLATNSIVAMANHTILTRKTDGEHFHIEDSAAPIRNPDGQIIGAVMVFHDVTERKIAQNRLHHIAFHDELTGLPNRTLFQSKLAEALSTAEQAQRHVAVLFMDLDRFKMINDSLGHGIGDEALIIVAQRLKNCVRDSDTVSRIGGDEFTAVIENLKSAQTVKAVAGKIIETLDKPFNIHGQELRISTSIGIAIYPQDGQDMETLLKNADTAMYYAKSCGRNNYQYYDFSMNAKAVETLKLETALHGALGRNEFFLEYQPKLDLKSKRIIGVEALLRWQNPDIGRVGPSEFIPRLEESGDIIQVGGWVLKTAIFQAKRWLDAGHSISVSVNVSARQLGQADFVDYIEATLKAAGLRPDLLRLEVTESILMSDTDRNELLLMQLVNLGVKISLDDFGTGYSSLSYLRRFPISELKIDRSFIVDIAKDQVAQKLVKTIINLGQSLDMVVTAEGVEEEEQCRELDRCGCNQIQGYYVSRPLGTPAFVELLERPLSESA